MRVPPDVELLVLLYHLYVAIDPLPADAVTDRFVGVPLIQTDWVDDEGCALIDGAALIVTNPDTVLFVAQPFELVAVT
jgi:hypothetical protein